MLRLSVYVFVLVFTHQFISHVACSSFRVHQVSQHVRWGPNKWVWVLVEHWCARWGPDEGAGIVVDWVVASFLVKWALVKVGVRGGDQMNGQAS